MYHVMLKELIKRAETFARCQLSGGLVTLRKFLIMFLKPHIIFRVCYSLLACACKKTDQKLRQSKLGKSGIRDWTHAKLKWILYLDNTSTIRTFYFVI